MMMFWSAIGCLLIGCIGLYTIGKNDCVETFLESSHAMENFLNETDAGHNILRIRMFEGSTEWLVATLVGFLGILGNLLIVKVSFHNSWCTVHNYVLQALQYIPPGKMCLLKIFELIVGYILYLCVSTNPLSGPRPWLDVGGVVCLGLVLVFTICEDFVVDVTRWRWF